MAIPLPWIQVSFNYVYIAKIYKVRNDLKPSLHVLFYIKKTKFLLSAWMFHNTLSSPDFTVS